MNAIKSIKIVKVDGITVVQLFVNGNFKTEVDVTSQYSKKQAIEDLMNM